MAQFRLLEVTTDQFFDLLPDREVNRADNKFKVYLGILGNFTLVLIDTKRDGMCAGISKRNPCDRDSGTGYKIAAVRAWRAYHGEDPGYCRQRPVTPNQAKRIAANALADKILYKAIESAIDGE